MKPKAVVFIRVYGIFLLLLTIAIVRLATGMDSFGIFTKILLVVAVGAVALLTEKRYIRQFTVSEGRVHITYITNFLRTHTDSFDLAGISNLKLDQWRRSSAVWPPYLAIHFRDEQRDYVIISREMYEQVQKETGVMTAATTV